MKVGMSVTGRLTPKKSGSPAKRDFLSSQSGPQIARSARVNELRRLVASGKYKVDGEQLAVKILAKALRDDK